MLGAAVMNPKGDEPVSTTFHARLLVDSEDVSDGGAGSSDPAHDDARQRSASILTVSLVAFFTVAGGPIGIEPVVQAAGPAAAFVGLFVFPLVFALPLCMFVAELSSMFPTNGAYVVWTDRALGRYFAFLNGVVSVFASILDIAIYPTLFISYLADETTVPTGARWALVFATTGLVVALNVKGLDLVGGASVVFFLAIFLPYVVMLLWTSTSGQLHPSTWVTGPTGGTYDYTLFVNTLYWNWSGWQGVSTIAGEVQNPQRTYPIAVSIAIFLAFLVYVVPLSVCTSLLPDSTRWEEGSLVTATQVLSSQMAVWVSVTAMLTSLAIHNAVMSTYSRTLWRVSRFGFLPRLFDKESPGPSPQPIYAIGVNALACIVLYPLGFNSLLNTTVFLSSVTLLLSVASFVVLKWTAPERARPFEVPGGKAGAVAVVLCPTAIVLTTIFLADAFTWILSGSILLATSLLYILWSHGWTQRLNKGWGPQRIRDETPKDLPEDANGIELDETSLSEQNGSMS